MPEIKNLGTELLYEAPIAFSLLFAGPALYMSQLDPIVREKLQSKKMQLQHWSTMYKTGLATMPIISLLATGTGIAAYVKTKENYWLYGALAIFSVIPYTLIALMPLNNRLNKILDETQGEIPEEKVETVVEGMNKWVHLHRVRGLIALGAAGIFFIARQLGKQAS